MKQAIVLIHGIGEQKPMDTLRRFVEALLESSSDDRPRYWNKPDRMSEIFELRRLSAVGRPTTHFFEYYWAWNVDGTTIFEVLSWLGGLMIRRRENVPDGARTIWWVSWMFVVSLISLLSFGSLAKIHSWIAAQDILSAVSVIVFSLGLLCNIALVQYLGDAARYLSPRPRNIRLRQSIRAQGVSLLRELQSRGPEPYDRIVIVGHSLGSVIAYDIINRLWQECNEELPGLNDPCVTSGICDCLEAKISPQPVLRDRLPLLARTLRERCLLGTDEADAAVREFQNAQHDAWCELRGLGNPWRISDLITAGSPLTHAMLLMAKSKSDLAARKEQRELPTCPPQLDEKGFSYSRHPPIDIGNGRKFTPLIYHHAAPFAVTRWTNLYFPVSWGLFGDVVGGPLAPVFGYGIRDVPVQTGAVSGLVQHTIAVHTRYWYCEALDNKQNVTRTQLAIDALRQAIAREQLHRFKPAPPWVPKPSDQAEKQVSVLQPDIPIVSE